MLLYIAWINDVHIVGTIVVHNGASCSLNVVKWDEEQHVTLVSPLIQTYVESSSVLLLPFPDELSSIIGQPVVAVQFCCVDGVAIELCVIQSLFATIVLPYVDANPSDDLIQYICRV